MVDPWQRQYRNKDKYAWVKLSLVLIAMLTVASLLFFSVGCSLQVHVWGKYYEEEYKLDRDTGSDLEDVMTQIRGLNERDFNEQDRVSNRQPPTIP